MDFRVIFPLAGDGFLGRLRRWHMMTPQMYPNVLLILSFSRGNVPCAQNHEKYHSLCFQTWATTKTGCSKTLCIGLNGCMLESYTMLEKKNRPLHACSISLAHEGLPQLAFASLHLSRAFRTVLQGVCLDGVGKTNRDSPGKSWWTLTYINLLLTSYITSFIRANLRKH